MEDPVRDLNDYLQATPNLQREFSWRTDNEGPEHETVYHVTAVFRGVNVGVGHGSSKGSAKQAASSQALEYLRSNSSQK